MKLAKIATGRTNVIAFTGGLMLLSCGTYANVIRWLPPLLVTAEQIDEAVSIFETAL